MAAAEMDIGTSALAALARTTYQTDLAGRKHQQGLDTRTPAGKAMFQMMGVFAEFERAIVQERVRAGLKRAKSEGKQLGRPRIARALEERIKKALAIPGRPGVRVIAKQFGVDPGTVQRVSRPFENVASVV